MAEIILGSWGSYETTNSLDGRTFPGGNAGGLGGVWDNRQRQALAGSHFQHFGRERDDSKQNGKVPDGQENLHRSRGFHGHHSEGRNRDPEYV